MDNDQDQRQGDPFEDPQAVAAGTLITLMRIYDVLMADLMLANREVYDKIYAKHSRGGLVAPMPSFSPEELL